MSRRHLVSVIADLGFRSPAPAGALPRYRGHRGVQVVADAEDPNEEAREHGADRGGQPVDPRADRRYCDHRGAQGRDGVQPSPQHRRDLPEEHISQRPPADAGNGAENDGRGRPQSQAQRLAGPGDGEQAQAGGVEHGYQRGQPDQLADEPERRQAAGSCHREVAPVGERRRRESAEEDVADDASAEAADHGHGHDPHNAGLGPGCRPAG